MNKNKDKKPSALQPPHSPILSEKDTIRNQVISSVEMSGNSQYAIAALPHIEPQERQKLIEVIDKDNERRFTFYKIKNKREFWKVIIVACMIFVVVLYMIFKSPTVPWQDILQALGYIAGGFGGAYFLIIRKKQ